MIDKAQTLAGMKEIVPVIKDTLTRAIVENAIGKDKNRTYYDVHCLPVSEKVSDEFNELDLVCVRHNGAFVSQRSISDMCMTLRKKVDGLGDFHFHRLGHTYSSKLIASGAPPKDVQELM